MRLPFENRRALVLGSEWLTARVEWRFWRPYVAWITKKICDMARKYRADRIYAHYPNGFFTVAAYQAAERLGLPLAIYFDIAWEERGWHDSALATEFEHKVVKRADVRFAITEYLVDYLSNKHDVKFELLPHTVDIESAGSPDLVASDPNNNVIHFAGGIYPSMNLDSILRCISAVNEMGHDVRFDVYTPSAECLRAAGLDMRRVRIGFAKRAEIGRLQRGSQVLFLPQAFESAAGLMIKLNFPTKALEYMVSGRPMLIHSPKGSYLADCARQNGFGVVVDTPDKDRLKEELTRLLTDRELCRDVVMKAWAFARSRDSRQWSQTLYAALFRGRIAGQ
jgi:glycosyltransferase involved in cell wall biosynthesis